MTSLSGSLQDACFGIATAIICCEPLRGAVAASIKGSVPGLKTLRVSLVDKCGDHLLHYPVIERDGYVEGPVIAVAKCKQGTAAWQSFHCSHLLRSDRHPDRCRAFVDWDCWQQCQHACDCVTLPLEAPEGVLGAVTVTVIAQPLTSEFISLLKGLAAHLALCLTHVRCKHDLEMAMSLLQKAYPSDVITRLLPDSATSGPMQKKGSWEASALSDSPYELEADGSSISDSSDDCEMMTQMQMPLPQWKRAMPYPATGSSTITPADFYRSWIQEFWNPKQSRCATSLRKQASGSGQSQQQLDASSSAGQCASSSMLSCEPPLQTAAAMQPPHHGLAEGSSPIQDHSAASVGDGQASCCGSAPHQAGGDVRGTRQDERLPPSRRNPGPASPSGVPQANSLDSSRGRPSRPAPHFLQQQPRQRSSLTFDRGGSSTIEPHVAGPGGYGAGEGGFRVQCARPGCGAMMQVLPEQLGLEPVTLERVELEPVTREQVLASDPALLSDTLAAPSFKQNWDLTFAKSRLEHKFCAWQSARLARLDAVHAVLLVLLSLASVLWPLFTASSGLPITLLCVQGLFFAFGVALFRARSFWSGYAQYREQIASAERLVVPPLCLLYAAVQGPAGWTALTHTPYMWALWGLLYFAVLRTVRWRVHLALLLPEACTRATAAVAASLCLHGQLVPGPSLLVLFQGMAACTVPAMGLYYSEWRARQNFVRNICKVHIE